MEFSYICHNKNCSYPGKESFTMDIDEQAVMDHKNMAVVFCPFCKKQMHPYIPENNASYDGKVFNRLH